MAAVALGMITVLAGPNTLHVMTTLASDGLVPLVNVTAATLAGMAVVRRIVPSVGRPLLVASGAGVGLGLVISSTLLLGLAGLLNVGTAWGLAALLALPGAIDIYFDQQRWRAAPGPALDGQIRPRKHSSFSLHPGTLAPWLWLLAAVPLGVATAGATLPPGILWGDEPHGYDVLSYHLQIPREWYEAGWIVPLDHNVFSHFPLGQETLSLLIMHQMGGPWEAMYAAQILSLLIMILATLAVTAAVSQLANGLQQSSEALSAEAKVPDPHVAPIVAGVIFATIPFTAMLASIAYNEALLLLATALAAAWMLRALGGDWRCALLAGLFVGLGAAAKYPAIPMLGVAGLAALAVALPWNRGARPCEMELLAFIGGAAVLVLPWLLRNFFWTGNPVFPLSTGLLGDGGWDPLLIERWHQAHSLAQGETRIGRVVEDLILNRRYALLLWPSAVAAGVWLSFRRDRRAIMLALWLGAMMAIWLFFTHLQGRFLIMAAPVAAILIGLAVTPRLRIAGLIAGALIAGAGFSYLVPTARQRMEVARSPELSLFGFRDLAQLTAIEDARRVGERELYLVGDARAFLYPVENLHYKVVFNVPPGAGALPAWLGDALNSAPDDALVIIDAAEVERLSRTYHGIPPLELPAPAGVVLMMRQVREALASIPPTTQPVQ